uniref:Aurora kinase n=1 Tax=Plectus sambesii TaxID=2011161 RepID=A0A914UIB8_9BILA
MLTSTEQLALPDYCKVVRVTGANGEVKEMIFPKALDLDRPKRPRTTFSLTQLNELEREFQRNQYLVGSERSKLAVRLHLTETQPQSVADECSFEEKLSRRGYVWDKGAELGAGRYSKVRVAIKLDSNIKVAMKVIDRRKVSEEYRRKFLPREVSIWSRLQHPNLCRLVGYFEIGHKVFLPMELAERGDLLLYVQRNGPIGEESARLWLLQLLAAVQYMHDLGVAHRDLKLENILIAADRSLKIADFGFCREVL